MTEKPCSATRLDVVIIMKVVVLLCNCIYAGLVFCEGSPGRRAWRYFYIPTRKTKKHNNFQKMMAAKIVENQGD